MVDDVARLGYEIDSSQALGAAKNLLTMERAAGQAASSAAKLQTTFRNANGTFQSAANFARQNADQIERLAQKYNPAMAGSLAFARAQKEVSDAVRLGVISIDQQEAVLERLQAQYATTTTGVNNFATGMGRVNNVQASVGNQFAQLNDIVVTSWGGMNPALIGMQQGMQVVQGLAGQSLPQALRTLGGAFATLLSPMTLLTVGVVAGGAALIQWGMSALDAGEDTDEFADSLDELGRIMDEVDSISKVLNSTTDELVETYGLASKRTLEFARDQAELAASQAARRMADSITVANEALRDFAVTSNSAFRSGTVLQTAMQNISRELGVTSAEARILERDFRAVRDADGFDEQAEALRTLIGRLREMGVPLEKLPDELEDAVNEMITLIRETDEARAAMDRLAGAAANVSVGVPLFLQGFSGDELIPPKPIPDLPRRRGGGGGGRDRAAEERARDLERFIESLQTEREVLEEWRIEQFELLAQFNDQELEAIGGQNEAKIRLEQEYQDRLAEIQENERMSRIQGMQSMFGDLTSLMQSGSAKLFKIGQAAAIANAIVDGWTAATSAWKWGMAAGGPALAAAAAAASLARTGVMIKNIADQKIGGGSGGGGAPSGASTSEPAQPDRVVRVSLNGSAFLAEIIDPIIKEIFEENNDGRRVIVERV